MYNFTIFFPRLQFYTVKYSNFIGLVFGEASSQNEFDEIEFFVNVLTKSSLFRFDYFIDAYAIDYPSHVNRFEVHYRLYSSMYSTCVHFIRLCPIVNGFASLPSFINFFSGSNWFEREIWDMFGIFFFNHPDLRRILTDYGFEGFPLRKDFPLSGYTQIRFDEVTRKVLYEPVEFSQEFRMFDFLNPWVS